MNDQYLTISESVAFTGKSAATIRRLINQMNNQNDQLINQMIKREGSGNKAKILIRRSFLEEKFLGREPAPSVEEVAPVNDNIVEFLQQQLETKDRQIEALNGQVSDLIRSKEHSDILLKQMQEVLLRLPAPEHAEEIKTPPPKPRGWAFWRWGLV